MNPGRNRPLNPAQRRRAKQAAKQAAIPKPIPPKPSQIVTRAVSATKKATYSSRPAIAAGHVELYTPNSDLHSNAAFTEAEEFAFMLGEMITVGVPQRSDWIEAAQWDERSQTITLWTSKGDRLGPYAGMGEAQARVFAQADSKGGWYWAIIRGRATTGAYPSNNRAFGQAGQPTPVAKKIVRKPGVDRKTWFRWW